MRPTELFPIFSPVTTLKGVGSQVAQMLGRLVHNDENATVLIKDILFQLPTGVVDRRNSPPLREAKHETICTFRVKVETHHPPGGGRFANKRPYKVVCSNDTGDITLVFFHAAKDYIEKTLPVGHERIISGKVEMFDFTLQMTHPDIIAPVSDLEKVQIIEPQYPLTAGLTNKRLKNIILQALEKVPEMPEWLPEAEVKQYGGLSFKQALLAAHSPKTELDILPTTHARMRLAFDELLAEQLLLSKARENSAAQKGILLPNESSGLWLQLKQQLPYQLTSGQHEILAEISTGLASGNRFIRLLQGDVGSGKTIIALFAMLRAVERAHQAALMVPTEIVAQQHFSRIVPLADALDVKTVLLTGSAKGAERKRALEQIENGDAQIIIGTHALFQEHVNFNSLALVVIDEQHRFGVEQRMALVNKGDRPHLLHMTATPIPRSLMMTLYGDMQTLILKDKPHGRKPITTRVIALSRADELLKRLEAALARGEKAYWICPQIEDKSTDASLFEQDIAAAELRFKEFHTRFGNKVALVHGRMKADQRQSAMQDFLNGNVQLLVATTVIEVGVDVPDATIIIIERAERFGLSQLHQLRGRVGRSDKESFCILLYADSTTVDARERLLTLRNHEDGFTIAEVDFKLRGGGELLGKRQAGQKQYRLATAEYTGDMLFEAHTLAEKLQKNPATEWLIEWFA